MLRDFLRYWLGVDDLEERVSEVEQEKAESSRVDRIDKRVRELEPVTIEATQREWEMLNVFLDADGFLSVSDLGDAVDTSKNNARAILNNLKSKVELDVKTVENGRKLYRLPEEERKRVFSRNQA